MKEPRHRFPGAAAESLEPGNAQWPDKKESGTSSAMATASFVLGLIACIFNVMLVTFPIGAILSLLSLIFGWVSIRREKQGYSGLILSLFSILVLMIWALTFLGIVLNDPTFTLYF